MKKAICMVAGLMVLSMLVPEGMQAQNDAGGKPNVVLMFIDDLGYGDTGPYGCEDIPTPHIDRLAKEGVRCTAAYITNPPCSPSRCSLIMGQYGQRFGKYGMSRGLPIPEDRPTLGEFMRDSGYITGFIGKWDIGSHEQVPLNSGFMEVAKAAPKIGGSLYVCRAEDGSKAWRTELDGDYLVEIIERNQARPFFIYFSPNAVHSKNIDAPERLKKRTTAESKRKPLAGNIVSVDDQVGKLLAVLEKHGLRENTLVIFTSDNGPNLGEKGSAAPYAGGKGSGTQKEGWVRVPAIYSFPGSLLVGKVYDGLTATFDRHSTLAALIGKPIPEHCDGVDLFPYLRGEKKGDAHEYLFWLNKDPTDPDHRNLVAVRWKNWRLYRHRESEQWKLFDLSEDPTEERDVASKHDDIVEAMSRQHAAWVDSLAPLEKVPNIKSRPQVPQGHGWAFANGEE